jgi:hypothetical protein
MSVSFYAGSIEGPNLSNRNQAAQVVERTVGRNGHTETRKASRPGKGDEGIGGLLFPNDL